MLYRIWDAERGPFGLLAVTTLNVFVISPLVVMGVLDQPMVDVFFIIIMVVGVLTVHPHVVMRYFVMSLATLAVLTRIAAKIVPGKAITVFQVVIEGLAIAIFAVLVIKQFLVAKRPASHRIAAAIVVYLLLGLLWSRLYEMTGLMIPRAFYVEEGSITPNSYLYFSFVTLTTIGYGDISPVHPVARNLAILEAITGQMYMAILIARLVSTSAPADRQR